MSSRCGNGAAAVNDYGADYTVRFSKFKFLFSSTNTSTRLLTLILTLTLTLTLVKGLTGASDRIGCYYSPSLFTQEQMR